MADVNDNLNQEKLFIDKEILASGVLDSEIIDSDGRKLVGNITLQLKLTGTGTVKVEFLQSNDYNTRTKTGDFVKASSGFEIVSAFTVGSGADADGKDILNVPMYNSKAFLIRVTETGGANPVNVSAWLSMQ